MIDTIARRFGYLLMAIATIDFLALIVYAFFYAGYYVINGHVFDTHGFGFWRGCVAFLMCAVPGIVAAAIMSEEI